MLYNRNYKEFFLYLALCFTFFITIDFCQHSNQLPTYAQNLFIHNGSILPKKIMSRADIFVYIMDFHRMSNHSNLKIKFNKDDASRKMYDRPTKPLRGNYNESIFILPCVFAPIFQQIFINMAINYPNMLKIYFYTTDVLFLRRLSTE